jgi:hypothetical protein
MCQIIAGAAVEPHLGAVLAGDNPEAVVLDLRAARAAQMAALGLWSGDRGRWSQSGGHADATT